MAFIKSLRAKVLLSALIPTVLVLVAVAVIALYAYEREARDVILQRDTELAKISAARLSEGLAQHSRILQTTATDEDVQSLEPARMRQALERVQSRLFVFDAGVVIYNDEGVAVWSDPFSFERRGKGIPVPSAFDQVRRAERPHFSDVFKDTYSDEHAIMLAVPIIASGREFMGVLVGMSTLKSLRSNAAFPQVLEITAGRKGFAYLVDGKGVVIHHRDSSEFATDLSSTVPVMGAIGGENGAVITKDSAGETVISGFAPVPGTSWGVITQERWESVVGPIRDYSKLLLGLLVLGGILSGGLIVFAVGRCLKPIKDVTRGAQRIAGGDFDHAITAKTGDEIQALAQQFNTMASALKESYSDLEQKVEARTEEVRESEERLRRAQQAGRLGTWDWNVLTNTLIWDGVEPIHGLEPGAFGGSFDAYVRDIHPEDQNTVMATISQAAEQGTELEMEYRIIWPDGSLHWVLGKGRAFQNEKGQTVHMAGTCQDITELKRSEEALLQQERDLAVLEERNRMAREIHDTLAQGFTGIVLQLEAAEQASERSPTEVPNHLSRAKNLARESLQEARRSVRNLVPHALEQLPLEAALQEEVHKFAAEGREKASFTLSGDSRVLPSDLQAALLRICQESLTNVRRHARATEVRVDLTFYPEAVRLGVQDNGIGFDLEHVKVNGKEEGFGLIGMEERARLLRGSLSIRSNGGKGTLVEARVPTA